MYVEYMYNIYFLMASGTQSELFREIIHPPGSEN